MTKRRRLLAIALAIVLLGGGIGGSVLLVQSRQHPAKDRIFHVTRELTVISMSIDDAHRQTDERASLVGGTTSIEDVLSGKATQYHPLDPTSPGWQQAYQERREINRSYVATLEQIDVSDCPENFRKDFEEYLRLFRQHLVDPVDVGEQYRAAGTKLHQTTESYGQFLKLPFGHRTITPTE